MEARKQKERPPSGQGIEELSLIEFPLALLSRRAPNGIKTLRTRDEITDSSTGQKVAREVIVTGSDAFGLPLGPDMDVLLALMALSQQKHGFRERTVEFSLYELRELLRWPLKHGEYNKRLKASLDRWLGTTVKFENSLRRNGRWVSTEGFGLIDNVQLTNTVRCFDPDTPQVFKWNDVVVEGMQAKNSKKLDWDFYIGLESSISKRLYRLLNKRFHNQSFWNYDLVSFCENKMGFLGKSYRATDYKKKLRPAIAELEQKNVIMNRSDKKRFEKGWDGNWRIGFSKPRNVVSVQASKPLDDISELARKLIENGMTQNTAVAWAEKEPDECKRQMEHFEFKVFNGWKPESSGGGYLNRAIKERFAPPDGFISRKDREVAAAKRAARKKAKQESEAAEERRRKAEHAKNEKCFNDFMSSLGSDSEREEFRERALENATPFAKKQYDRALLQAGGDTSGLYLDIILRNQVENELADKV
jgi:hypothetical protein